MCLASDFSRSWYAGWGAGGWTERGRVWKNILCRSGLQSTPKNKQPRLPHALFLVWYAASPAPATHPVLVPCRRFCGSKKRRTFSFTRRQVQPASGFAIKGKFTASRAGSRSNRKKSRQVSVYIIVADSSVAFNKTIEIVFRFSILAGANKVLGLSLKITNLASIR